MPELSKPKILQGFRNFILNRTIRTHLIFVALTIIGGVVVYNVSGHTTQFSLAEQMLHREQIVTRSGVLSISSFLTSLGRNLSIFSSRQEVINGDIGLTTKSINKFIDTWSSTRLQAIVLIDKSGKVVIDSNQFQAPELGMNLSDRTYFQWSEHAQAGNYYVGFPIISRLGVTKDKYVIPIATPVFDKTGKFNGALVAIVSLQFLADKYITPLKISDNTNIYMLDSGANMVFSTIDQYSGKNLFDLAGDMNFPGKDKLIKTFRDEFAKPINEGKLDVNLPDPNQEGKVSRSLIAYSEIDLGSNPGSPWYLVISTPASDAFLFTGAFYTDQVISLIYLIVIILSFSMLAITSKKIARRC